MPSIVKMLRAAADPNRLRILLLLKQEELSVAELQEILTMGQSTISTHLSQLKQAGLVTDRRVGKNILYSLADASPAQKGRLLQSDPETLTERNGSQPLNGALGVWASAPDDSSSPGFLEQLLAQANVEIAGSAHDHAAMRRVLKKRQDRMRAFFDSMAGRLGRDYVPGKSWKSLAEALLRLMPPQVIADLGAGDGSFSILLAQRAERVIAVDASEKMLEVGRDQAQRNGMENIEFRAGDMEEMPIESGTVDIAFFSQSLHHALHPRQALKEAARILKPGGRVAVLDLARHRFEEARELYADEWLGFSEAELEQMLADAGFKDARVAIVDRDPDAPQFQTLLGIAEKIR
ncbi:MAG TPA: metalloregulator ArsR/SmtB family transcription factor [Terracidiphilus sp.]|jgi:ArsR family transcriptional regulator